MRELTRSDIAALVAPLVVVAIAVAIVGTEDGWESALIVAVLFATFTIWFWRRQIRKHPEDTWRARF